MSSIKSLLSVRPLRNLKFSCNNDVSSSKEELEEPKINKKISFFKNCLYKVILFLTVDYSITVYLRCQK